MDRCDICGWPFAKSRDEGCVPGDCSERPVPKVRFSDLGKPIATINVREYEKMRAALIDLFETGERALVDGRVTLSGEWHEKIGECFELGRRLRATRDGGGE